MVKSVQNLTTFELLTEYYQSLPHSFIRISVIKGAQFNSLTAGLPNIYIGSHGAYRIGSSKTNSINKMHLLTDEYKDFMKCCIKNYREIAKKNSKVYAKNPKVFCSTDIAKFKHED